MIWIPISILGSLWAFPTTLIGLLAALTIYFPKSIHWYRGTIVIVVRWSMIPKGFDRNGDGDLDDPDDFLTGGQTWSLFMFLRDEQQREHPRLLKHEHTHSVQNWILGPVFGIIYGGEWLFRLLAMRQDAHLAYHNLWLERWARRSAGQRV